MGGTRLRAHATAQRSAEPPPSCSPRQQPCQPRPTLTSRQTRGSRPTCCSRWLPGTPGSRLPGLRCPPVPSLNCPGRWHLAAPPRSHLSRHVGRRVGSGGTRKKVVGAQGTRHASKELTRGRQMQNVCTALDLPGPLAAGGPEGAGGAPGAEAWGGPDAAHCCSLANAAL